MLKLYFDKIYDKIPIPNGLEQEDLVNIYLKYPNTYSLYHFLEVPYIPSKNYNIEYVKLKKDSHGIYPLCFNLDSNDLINHVSLKYLFYAGVSDLARQKIEDNDLRVIIFIGDCNRNIQLDLSSIVLNFVNFTTNFLTLVEFQGKKEVYKSKYVEYTKYKITNLRSV